MKAVDQCWLRMQNKCSLIFYWWVGLLIDSHLIKNICNFFKT